MKQKLIMIETIMFFLFFFLYFVHRESRITYENKILLCKIDDTIRKFLELLRRWIYIHMNTPIQNFCSMVFLHFFMRVKDMPFYEEKTKQREKSTFITAKMWFRCLFFFLCSLDDPLEQIYKCWWTVVSRQWIDWNHLLLSCRFQIHH